MNELTDILRKFDHGYDNLFETKPKLIAWSDARCSTRGKLTPELIKAISQKIEDDYTTARGFCTLHATFTPGYLSNLKKGNKQRVTNKVILLCEALGIRISEFVILVS